MNLTHDRELAELAEVSADTIDNWRSGAVRSFKLGTLDAHQAEPRPAPRRAARDRSRLAGDDLEAGLHPLSVEDGSGPANLQRQFREFVAYDISAIGSSTSSRRAPWPGRTSSSRGMSSAVGSPAWTTASRRGTSGAALALVGAPLLRRLRGGAAGLRRQAPDGVEASRPGSPPGPPARQRARQPPGEGAFVQERLRQLVRAGDWVWLEVGFRLEPISLDPLFGMTQVVEPETASEANRRLLLEGPYRRWEAALGRRPRTVRMRVSVREDDESSRVSGSCNFCHDLVIDEERRACTMLPWLCVAGYGP